METNYNFTSASRVAAYIADLLRPHCERLHVAGSVRRLRPEVKDIEIICQPKREERPTGMFPEITESIVDRNFVEALATITDIVILGNVNGRYMKIKTTSKICPGITLDLFMPQPDDYFRQYAIRTGSADYANHVIAHAWKRKGWCGVKELGLRLISECDNKKDAQNKTIYSLKKDLAAVTLPPVWKSEGEFFTWLGLNYIDPEIREYSPVNLAQ